MELAMILSLLSWCEDNILKDSVLAITTDDGLALLLTCLGLWRRFFFFVFSKQLHFTTFILCVRVCMYTHFYHCVCV